MSSVDRFCTLPVLVRFFTSAVTEIRASRRLVRAHGLSHNSLSPRCGFSTNTILPSLTDARMSFGDEQAGLVAQCVHSATLKRMLQLKMTTGERLLKIVSQDAARGVIEFEGVPLTFVSDAMPVEFPVRADGAGAPAVTLSGMAFGDYVPRLQITGAGARGVALFRWSIDNGTIFSIPGALNCVRFSTWVLIPMIRQR